MGPVGLCLVVLLFPNLCFAQNSRQLRNRGNVAQGPLILPANGADSETHLTDADFANAASVTDAPGQQNTFSLQMAGKKKNLLEGDINGITKRGVTDFVTRSNAPPMQSDSLKGPLRNAIRNTYQLWPGGKVPYAISSRYSSSARQIIAAAIQEYHTRTCIRFVPRTNERDYVYIEPDDGCYSSVGREGGKQTVSLGDGCMIKGVAMHELMHSLGFFHEQSRTDRDQYITVVYNNIVPGMEDNFQKYGLDTLQYLGTQYDYGSIMHYEDSAFSKNGQPTIIPKQRNARIGQRKAFSQTDITKLNRLYKCGDSPGSAGGAPSPVGPIDPGRGDGDGDGESEWGGGGGGRGGWRRGGRRGGWGGRRGGGRFGGFGRFGGPDEFEGPDEFGGPHGLEGPDGPGFGGGGVDLRNLLGFLFRDKPH